MGQWCGLETDCFVIGLLKTFDIQKSRFWCRQTDVVQKSMNRGNPKPKY